MRTTIEIKDDHRARLLELAARRKEKGFSTIVAEAIEVYLKEQADHAEARRQALEVCGALSSRDTKRMRLETSKLRKSWR